MKKIIIDGYNVAHQFFPRLIKAGELKRARRQTLALVKKNFSSADIVVVWDNNSRGRKTYERKGVKVIFSRGEADKLITRLAKGEKIILFTADRDLAKAVKREGGEIHRPRELAIN